MRRIQLLGLGGALLLFGRGGSHGGEDCLPAGLEVPCREDRGPSGSMEPTLRIGSRVTVSTGAPEVGDIVVFHPPSGAEQEECGPRPHVVKLDGSACASSIPREELSTVLIKRIVAGP